MLAPDQAAILCGGLGSRLRPITDKIPKPMVPVNGVPFLEHLIFQLKENGIVNFVLLTGYLGDQIQQYFGDGSKLGVKIQYSQGPATWETGRRLHHAKNLLKDIFMILYSDNFVQFNLKKLTEFYEDKKTLLCFMVQAKSNGNIRLGEDGIVELYDKTRSSKNIDFVELGYMIASKKIFQFITNENSSFSDAIFKLVLEHQVAGMVGGDAYHSISDPDRWRLTEKYLTPKKILLIDRDGVINHKAPKGEYIDSWGQFSFIRENIQGMKSLSNLGFSFIIISNQAGIGRKMVSEKTVISINEKMKSSLEKEGIKILGVYVCPHHWEDNCFCRKPNPGLFFKATKEWLFRLDKTIFIGDDPRDCQAAYNAGCGSIYIGNKSDLADLSIDEQPCGVFNNLEEALPVLEKI
jgi:histidinol-phosphate phosphatase family protein